MATVKTIQIKTDCHHKRTLYAVRPWIWGRPCGRCMRSMSQGVTMVPSSGAAVVAVNNGRLQSSAVVAQQQIIMPQQQMILPQQQMIVPQQQAVPQAQTALAWQSSQEAYPTALPPKYAL
ncbi:GH11774 [Drosophila grimshawi]|uniref:GH11774 n=1 Tax=Drosophila grimshawi TaxID=7222 RepID=B4K266_DROGR|nr:GH11774 [Drosophila grimshawi]